MSREDLMMQLGRYEVLDEVEQLQEESEDRGDTVYGDYLDHVGGVLRSNLDEEPEDDWWNPFTGW